MTDQPLNPVPVDPPVAAPPHRRPQLRVVGEFVVLFAGAFLIKQTILGGGTGGFPSPYWFPVVVLSLQYGLTASIIAAVIAAALNFAHGLPPSLLTEDVYDYIGRIAAEPVAWSCVALLIGHTRSREIERLVESETQLGAETARGTAVAELCEQLRRRVQTLERHIAANANASVIDIAEAITGLYEPRWDTIGSRVTRFVTTVMGTADFAVYLRRDNGLRLVFPKEQQGRNALSVTVEPDTPLFSAVVRDGKTLAASRLDDLRLLGEHEVLIGPLIDSGNTDHVIGMVVIGGADLADFPTDVERRFALTCAQLSRLFARAILIDDWRADVPTLHGIEQAPQVAHYRNGASHHNGASPDRPAAPASSVENVP